MEPLICPYCNKDVSTGHRILEVSEQTKTSKGVDIKVLKFVSEHKSSQVLYVCEKKNRVFGKKETQEPEYKEGLMYEMMATPPRGYEIITDEK